MHAEDGLADQTPLDQVLKYEAGRTIVYNPLKERRASKHNLQTKIKEKRKLRRKVTG